MLGSDPGFRQRSLRKCLVPVCDAPSEPQRDGRRNPAAQARGAVNREDQTQCRPDGGCDEFDGARSAPGGALSD